PDGDEVKPLSGLGLASRLVQGYLKKRVRAGRAGPSDEERAMGKRHFWGEVTDGAGKRAEARMHGPESYTLTVLAALAVVERVLAGHAPVGYQTPSTAYGPDFVLGCEGSRARGLKRRAYTIRTIRPSGFWASLWN